MTRIKNYLSVFGRYRYLLKNLIHRDISVKYRRSALGFLWSFLNPILMMLVMTAVFSYLFEQMLGTITNFPVYLLTGQLMFNFFSEATNLGMDSILMNSALVKKVYIPKYLFPLEKVLFSLINALFSLVALVLVMLVTSAPITPWILMFPVPMLLLFLFCLGISFILSSLVIFFRDVKHLYSVVVLALTYLTPIFWVETNMFSAGGFMATAIKFNPMYWYVGMFRQVVYIGAAPTALQWLITGSCALVTMVAGMFILKKTQDRFILYM